MKICLKDVRESRAVTQEAIAQHIGVTQTFISRVENGTKDMSFSLMTEIADYLDVSLDEIAGRQKPETKANLENRKG